MFLLIAILCAACTQNNGIQPISAFHLNTGMIKSLKTPSFNQQQQRLFRTRLMMGQQRQGWITNNKPIAISDSSRSSSIIELSARKRPSKNDNNIVGSSISNKRRQQLGIPDGEREYDLDVALNTNTDPLITKIIAGSFILVVIALLVVGVIIPSTADFGEGICSPIQNGGRC